MNKLDYKLLDSFHIEGVLNEEYLNHLYDFYYTSSVELECIAKVSKEDFNKFFIVIYDSLKSKINDLDFENLSKFYVKLIIHDEINNKDVDIDWFINNIYYFTFSLQSEAINNCKNLLKKAKQKLIAEIHNNESKVKKKTKKNYTDWIV